MKNIQESVDNLHIEDNIAVKVYEGMNGQRRGEHYFGEVILKSKNNFTIEQRENDRIIRKLIWSDEISKLYIINSPFTRKYGSR
jgi:hypothetical protein